MGYQLGIAWDGIPTLTPDWWVFLLFVVIDFCKIQGESYLGAISRSCLSILHLCDTPDVNNTHLKRDMGSPCRRLGISPRVLSTCISTFPVSPKHFYNICTMLDQRRRRWADVVQNVTQMFCGLPILFQLLPIWHIAVNQLNVQMCLEPLNLGFTVQKNRYILNIPCT